MSELTKDERVLLGRLLHDRVSRLRRVVPIVYEPEEFAAEVDKTNVILGKLDQPKVEP